MGLVLQRQGLRLKWFQRYTERSKSSGGVSKVGTYHSELPSRADIGFWLFPAAAEAKVEGAMRGGNAQEGGVQWRADGSRWWQMWSKRPKRGLRLYDEKMCEVDRSWWCSSRPLARMAMLWRVEESPKIAEMRSSCTDQLLRGRLNGRCHVSRKLQLSTIVTKTRLEGYSIACPTPKLT
jgi:hypothetical protein